MRTFINVEKNRQKILKNQYKWLHEVSEMQMPPAILSLSISYFEHWLSLEEALEFLTDVSAEEQKKRDELFFSFMKELARDFEVDNFTFRGRQKNRPVFRRFISAPSATAFLLPKSLGGTRNKAMEFVLNQQDAAFFEGYDDTFHLYFKNREQILPILALAEKCGLHILEHH